jgi:hypothetical protein
MFQKINLGYNTHRVKKIQNVVSIALTTYIYTAFPLLMMSYALQQTTRHYLIRPILAGEFQNLGR